MLSSSLKSAQEALDSFSADMALYNDQLKAGVHNPALVALDRIINGQSVNTDFYISKRIESARSKG